jgi:hypothetical protein
LGAAFAGASCSVWACCFAGGDPPQPATQLIVIKAKATRTEDDAILQRLSFPKLHIPVTPAVTASVSIQNTTTNSVFDAPAPIAQLCLRRVMHAIGMSQFREMSEAIFEAENCDCRRTFVWQSDLCFAGGVTSDGRFCESELARNLQPIKSQEFDNLR